MSENSTNTELLIRFLDKELSESETLLVQDSLQQSSELQKEFEQLSMARDAVKSFGLKNQVAAVHQEMMKEFGATSNTQKAPVISLFKWTMRIAAGLFFVILTSAVYLYFTVSGNTIYDSKYSDYTISNTRSAETASPIVNAYKAKDYAKLIELSRFFKSINPENVFLTGMAYLQTNQPAEASKTLEFLLTQKEPGFKEDAEYYLALAYIKVNNTKSALELFKKIKSDKLHTYHEKVSTWDIRKLELVQWKK